MFKINISTKDGKTFKLETEAPALKQHKLGDTVKGEEISPDLAGYELEITGTSDFAGFTSMKGVEGIGLKKVLLGYGKAMHKRPKGDKKKPRPLTGGLKLRKTVRGTTISDAIIQINTKIIKEGPKKLSEIFADQNKTKAPAEKPAEEKKPEVKVSEKSEPKEPKVETPAQEQSEKPSEPKQAPNEAKPEQEPKESEASKQEKAKPDEEPKS